MLGHIHSHPEPHAAHRPQAGPRWVLGFSNNLHTADFALALCSHRKRPKELIKSNSYHNVCLLKSLHGLPIVLSVTYTALHHRVSSTSFTPLLLTSSGFLRSWVFPSCDTSNGQHRRPCLSTTLPHAVLPTTGYGTWLKSHLFMRPVLTTLYKLPFPNTPHPASMLSFPPRQ